MRVTFRPLRWAGPSTPPRQRRSRSAFKAGWQSTLDLLDRELRHLQARDVVIEADFREQDIRLDGMPRSNARSPEHPGVRVAFESKHGPLVYATDSCAYWQHNVRSIALGLEALRAVDRYGVTKRGEQYTGWKALPAGESSRSGASTPVAMTVEEAAEFLLDNSGIVPVVALRGEAVRSLIENRGNREAYFRRCASRLHPDRGGSKEDFHKLMEAKGILDRDATRAGANSALGNG